MGFSFEDKKIEEKLNFKNPTDKLLSPVPFNFAV
jgi:hypothetical protein